MPQPHLRAADTDRAAVAAVLGEHMAAGRLTLEEYDERLTRAYAARTFGELAELTADLPADVPAHLPEPAQPTALGPRTARRGVTWGADWGGHAWQAWIRTSLIVLTIWAVTSLLNWEFIYFWPAWVMGPWGAVLLAQSLMNDDEDDEDEDDQPRGIGS